MGNPRNTVSFHLLHDGTRGETATTMIPPAVGLFREEHGIGGLARCVRFVGALCAGSQSQPGVNQAPVGNSSGGG